MFFNRSIMNYLKSLALYERRIVKYICYDFSKLRLFFTNNKNKKLIRYLKKHQKLLYKLLFISDIYIVIRYSFCHSKCLHDYLRLVNYKIYNRIIIEITSIDIIGMLQNIILYKLFYKMLFDKYISSSKIMRNLSEILIEK